MQLLAINALESTMLLMFFGNLTLFFLFMVTRKNINYQ
jgi:hypothetical protein